MPEIRFRACAPQTCKGIGQDFGVAPVAECHAALFQLAAQFGVIVDFAVEGNQKPAVEGGLGLHAIVAVDDAQPPRAHRGVLVRTDQGIGDVAAMPDAGDHLLDDKIRILPIDCRRYAAHGTSP